jgi:hypothetical protein
MKFLLFIRTLSDKLGTLRIEPSYWIELATSPRVFARRKPRIVLEEKMIGMKS